MGVIAASLLCGLLIGFPTKTVGALIIQRLKDEGIKCGALVSLGAGVMELVYALIAFGFYWTLHSAWGEHLTLFLLCGFFLFVAMGVRSLLWPQEELSPDWDTHSSLEQFLAGIVVRIGAPGPLLYFFALAILAAAPIQGWEFLLWFLLVMVGLTISHTVQLGAKALHLAQSWIRIERVWGGLLCLCGVVFLIRMIVP